MNNSGFSVKVAWDASSIQEWFDSTSPLKLIQISPELGMKFRKRFIKGFLIPGQSQIYIALVQNNLMIGCLAFNSYGAFASIPKNESDIYMLADTTPSEWDKSTDLLLFAMRTKECKELLENKFNREIKTIYTKAFSLNPTIQRYKKHGKLTYKKIIAENNKVKIDEKIKNRARSSVKIALQKNIITKQPCEVCGSIEYVEAHHKDYSKPLEIKWLCIKHHHEADIKDESCYKLLGYDLGYTFEAGSIVSLKEAKAQFIQKTWKK